MADGKLCHYHHDVLCLTGSSASGLSPPPRRPDPPPPTVCASYTFLSLCLSLSCRLGMNTCLLLRICSPYPICMASHDLVQKLRVYESNKIFFGRQLHLSFGFWCDMDVVCFVVHDGSSDYDQMNCKACLVTHRRLAQPSLLLIMGCICLSSFMAIILAFALGIEHPRTSRGNKPQEQPHHASYYW